MSLSYVNNFVLLNAIWIPGPIFHLPSTGIQPGSPLHTVVRLGFVHAGSTHSTDSIKKVFPFIEGAVRAPAASGAIAAFCPCNGVCITSEDHISIIYLLNRSHHKCTPEKWRFALRFASHGCLSSLTHSLHTDRCNWSHVGTWMNSQISNVSSASNAQTRYLGAFVPYFRP